MSREGVGRKRRIAASFGAASDYERSAEIQARVARSLAAMLPPELAEAMGGGFDLSLDKAARSSSPESPEPGADGLRRNGPRERGALGAEGGRENGFPGRESAPERGEGESPSGLRSPPLVLEVGCGTGLLGRALIGRLPPASRVAFTDISPDMVRRARQGLAESFPSAVFAAMDAEASAVRPGFDLVVSSMALQWASDLGATLRGLAGLLKPGGRLLVALPGRESFSRWREACGRLGLSYGGPLLPSVEELAGALPGEGTEIREERLRVGHADALAFFRSLKAIGARVPAPGYAPMGAADFKRLLRAMDRDAEPFEMDYQALYALHVKAGR